MEDVAVVDTLGEETEVADRLLCYNSKAQVTETVCAFRRDGTFANEETECTMN